MTNSDTKKELDEFLVVIEEATREACSNSRDGMARATLKEWKTTRKSRWAVNKDGIVTTSTSENGHEEYTTWEQYFAGSVSTGPEEWIWLIRNKWYFVPSIPMSPLELLARKS